MSSNLFHVVLAICLVIGIWFASHGTFDRAAATNVAPAGRHDSASELDAMDLRTGDRFWGYFLCGVVPCSNLVAKGGGHLVTLSLQDDRDARFFFHVVGAKKIKLAGKEFQLRVIAPDQVHVERAPRCEAAVATR